MALVQVTYNRDAEIDKPAVINLPGSKSMAARLLILDYIRGVEKIRSGLPECDDTRFLAQAIEQMISKPAGEKYYLGSGAASLRFFVALAASVEGFDAEVDVSPQLRRRPLAPLVDSLRAAGAHIEYLKQEGYPPLYIKGKKLKGGRIEVNGAVSSQFISALLMASLLWENPAEIKINGETVSAPYIDLTRRMIVRREKIGIESDWSAAAFFYEIALLCPDREIRISGLPQPGMSLQGDSGIVAIMGLIGVESRWQEDGDVIIKGNDSIISRMKGLPVPLEFDMGDMPDAVPALAVAMALAGIRFRFVNVAHLRHKESNRLEGLKGELEHIGIAAEVSDDSIEWLGARLPVAENEVIESNEDHRIAMAFSPAAIRLGYVTIRDPQCVDKSFPDYFDQIEKLGLESRFIGIGPRPRLIEEKS